MKIEQTTIPGCLEILPQVLRDKRGSFVKTFHRDFFAEHGLATRFAEKYYSVSGRGVLRGLHFQVPPHAHAKLVHCISGEVLDAVLDLRVGSPTYGKWATFKLCAEKASMIYIPAGLAHGFYVTGDNAIMVYMATTVHSPAHDTGILWNSAGIPWPDDNPVISERDGNFVKLTDFTSPFCYAPEDLA